MGVNDVGLEVSNFATQPEILSDQTERRRPGLQEKLPYLDVCIT
jgi:hypothetical protein